MSFLKQEAFWSFRNNKDLLRKNKSFATFTLEHLSSVILKLKFPRQIQMHHNKL